MKNIYDLYPDTGHGSSSGNQMLPYNELFSQVSDTDDKLTLAIRELVQNSLDPIDDDPNVQKTKVRITLKKLTYDFISLDGLKDVIDKCINEVKKGFVDENYKTNKSYKSLLKVYKKLENTNSQLDTIIIEDISGGLSGDSRFYTENGDGLKNLTGTFNSNKSKGGGSHGVGKVTAFNLSSINTVFYVNQHKNKTRFIGRTIASTYFDKEKDLLSGPEFYFGKKREGAGLIYGDYALLDKTPPKLKFLDGDGLSTIIPIDEIKDYKDWTDKVVFSVISNYYRNFLSDNLEVEVANEFNNSKQIINKKKIQNIYRELGHKPITDKQQSFVNYHKYEMIKPQILNHLDPLKEVELDISFEYNKDKKYNDICKISFFKNSSLQEILDNEPRKMQNYMKQNFRILRGNTLIRSHYLPGSPKKSYPLSDYSYSGIIEFQGPFNHVVRQLETQSHDKLNFDYIENDLPNRQHMRKYVFSKINNIISETIDELSGNDSRKDEEFSVNFDSMFENESENDSPSYKRRLFNEEDIKRFIEKNQPSNNSNSGQNRENKSLLDAQLTPDGDVIFIKKRKFVKPPNPNPSPSPNPKPDVPSTNTGKKNEKGVYKLKNHEYSNGLIFKSVLIDSIDKIHIYDLLIEGGESFKKIKIMQDSLIENSFLSFELKKIKVNDRELKLDDISFEYLDGLPSSFTLLNVNSTDKKIKIKIEVEEVENTVSEFKIELT